ncbi:MAG: hydrogenase iron-sulfur subunit [Candidatus Bathyarchaeota archaeon]|nr:hydrogenase iron-sulfur subunit [Candidatus Bathyarchaeota archaeon]MDH5786897.1 hydrogenase iron-sulfur subunit [Candidatus Bathyarchaeota archaeon]
MENNEPKIACFMCNFAFCQTEMRIPSNTSIARVNCIGRIDPVLILEMLEKGADAVMLVGCKPPDCHYIEGNSQAEITVKVLKKLMCLAGLEPERLKLLWYSPIDKKSFSSYTKEYTEEMRKLVLSPIKKAVSESPLMINILAAKNVASEFRLRVLLGREKELTESVNVYGEKIPIEEFNSLLEEIVASEFVQQKIHVLTQTKPLSIKTLSEAVGMKPATVLRQIVNMRRRNMMTLDHIEGTTPFYKALEVK